MDQTQNLLRVFSELIRTQSVDTIMMDLPEDVFTKINDYILEFNAIKSRRSTTGVAD